MPSLFSLVLLVGAVAFSWCAANGVRNGQTYIPLPFIRDDSYERDDKGFGFALAMNFLGAAVCLSVGIVIWTFDK